MKRTLLCLALLPLGGCAIILGIEPPPISDAAVDGLFADGANDGGSGGDATTDGPIGFCESMLSANPYFCEDFDEHGLTQWDGSTGTGISLVNAPTDSGVPSQPLMLEVNVTGSIAYLTKGLFPVNMSTATITFSAQIDCTGAVDVLQMTPSSPTTSLGPLKIFSGDGGNLEVIDTKTNAHKNFGLCTTGWHTFKIEFLSSEVFVQMDGAETSLEKHDAGSFTGVTMLLGVVGVPAGQQVVHADNVLVTP